MYKLPPGENGKERGLPEDTVFRNRGKKRKPGGPEERKTMGFRDFRQTIGCQAGRNAAPEVHTGGAVSDK